MQFSFLKPAAQYLPRPAMMVGHRAFEWVTTGLILSTALLIGLETMAGLSLGQRQAIEFAHALLLTLFVLEVMIRILAHHPNTSEFFRDPWNVYDLIIATLSLLPWEGDYAIIGRLLRLLRVIRLVARFGELRLIVATLLKSLPSMGHILMLLCLIFYVYAVMGYHTLHVIDPVHFGSLGTTFLTLFRIMTLEDWTDIMYVAMETLPYSWVYFVTFVVVTAFVVINLFIALVLSNLSEMRRDQREADRAEQGGDLSLDVTMELMRKTLAAYDAAEKPREARETVTPN